MTAPLDSLTARLNLDAPVATPNAQHRSKGIAAAIHQPFNNSSANGERTFVGTAGHRALSISARQLS